MYNKQINLDTTYSDFSIRLKSEEIVTLGEYGNNAQSNIINTYIRNLSEKRQSATETGQGIAGFFSNDNSNIEFTYTATDNLSIASGTTITFRNEDGLDNIAIFETDYNLSQTAGTNIWYIEIIKEFGAVVKDTKLRDHNLNYTIKAILKTEPGTPTSETIGIYSLVDPALYADDFGMTTNQIVFQDEILNIESRFIDNALCRGDLTIDGDVKFDSTTDRNIGFDADTINTINITGGNVNIEGAENTGIVDSGDVSISGGDSDQSGFSGDVNISSGTNTGLGGAGSINVVGGVSNSNNKGGTINVTGGYSTSGDGGDILVTGGEGGSGTGDDGGNITVIGGEGDDGGNITINGGLGVVDGGDITLKAGLGTNEGFIKLNSTTDAKVIRSQVQTYTTTGNKLILDGCLPGQMYRILAAGLDTTTSSGLAYMDTDLIIYDDVYTGLVKAKIINHQTFIISIIEDNSTSTSVDILLSGYPTTGTSEINVNITRIA